jgi:hypothetical protein
MRDVIRKNETQEAKKYTGREVFVRLIQTKAFGAGPVTVYITSQWNVVLARTGIIHRWQLQQKVRIFKQTCPGSKPETVESITPLEKPHWVQLPSLPFRDDEIVLRTYWTITNIDAVKMANDYAKDHSVTRGKDEDHLIE